MKLQELFDKSAEIKNIKKDKYLWIADFTVNDKTYEFSAAFHADEEDWGIEFYFEDTKENKIKSGITGTGDELLIFSTVLKIIDKFIKEKNYPNISFSAEEPSRKKLYDRMIKILSSKYGYKLDKALNYGKKRYRLVPE